MQQLVNDIKNNGRGVINLLEIDNSLELLSAFQLFYHNNGRFLLKNRLLTVLDDEKPEVEGKINLKNLHEMF